MNELVWIALIIGVVVALICLLPFFYGDGSALTEASTSDDPSSLEHKRDGLLKRWIQDERAKEKGEITEREWAQRKAYLLGRYADTVRRLEWLKKTSVLIVGCLFAFFSSTGFSQAQLAPKQLLILKPGIEKIYGTWVAAVMNHTDKPSFFRLPVFLPKEATDFKLMEGASDQDVKIADDGVWVERQFEPGVQVVSFAFAIEANQGQQVLTLTPKVDLGELSVMTPMGMLEITGTDFVAAPAEMQNRERYQVLVSSKTVLAGSQQQILVSGVPLGRRQLWYVGGGFALVIFGSACMLTWKTRLPRNIRGGV